MLVYCGEKVKEKRISLYECPFSRREIREYSGWDLTTTRRLFDELEKLEYIRKVRGDKRGMQYLYKLVPFDQVKTGDDDLHLLDPDSL
jgi:DNA-binding MarR family transcriptional regulator